MQESFSLEGFNRLGIQILNKFTSNRSATESEEKNSDSKRAKLFENPGLFSENPDQSWAIFYLILRCSYLNKISEN